MKEFLEETIRVVPSARQLKWFEMGFYAFIHFGMNTFTGREWGNSDEPESFFHPQKLDCDQWVSAIKAAGMKGLILTAKHHDGFCLWPSRYTEHSVKNSPYPGDIVKEAAEACRRGGISFGFYLSPWDRNSKLYGTDSYNDYFCNQLTELLTQYGDIFCVWFDNACGEGPNGVKQNYDFPRYFDLIRKYQPDAVIFNDFGPDTRWIGNEAGKVRENEWAVVPSELCKYSKIQTKAAPLADKGDLSFLYNTSKSLGTLDVVMFSKGLTFTPAEVDTSIRPGWFWHEKENPKSLEQLFEIYIDSVGGNCCLNLNVPPNTDGLIDARDVKRLKELGELINSRFGKEIPSHCVQRSGEATFQKEYEIVFEKHCNSFRYVVIEEDLTRGQRVESFQILLEKGGYDLFPLYEGRTIGNRKICELTDSSREQNTLLFDSEQEVTDKLILRVTSARGDAFFKNIKVY